MENYILVCIQVKNQTDFPIYLFLDFNRNPANVLPFIFSGGGFFEWQGPLEPDHAPR